MISNIDAAVAIIFDKSNKFLLQKKDLDYKWFPGKWCLFGGGLEEGEDGEKALRRELAEEIRFLPSSLNFFSSDRYEDRAGSDIRKGKVYVYSFIFNGRIKDISLGEGAGFAFFDITELDHLNMVDYNRQLIKDFYKINMNK